MNCSRCGFENEQSAAFCSHCGAPLPMAAPPQGAAPQADYAPPQGTVPQAGYVPPQGLNQQSYAQQGYTQPGYTPPKKKRTGLVIGLVAGGVALIGAVVAAYFLFFSGPGIKGLWVCKDRGWALRIEDSVLTEYGPAGTDKTSYTYQSGQGETMLSGGETSFTVKGDEMSLVDEETGEQYLFTRQDDADIESVVTAGFRGLWSSEELGGVIELGKKGALTLHSASGEADGSYGFDLKKGRGTITLGEDEYSFTAGWDVLTVDTVGDFTRADKGLDVAAFVQQHGKSPLAATIWYETTGQYGSITFAEEGTFLMELYGQTATGGYSFDASTGAGALTSDSTGETTDFVLLDGTLTLEGMTYTQEYVEQPGAADFYTAIAGVWMAVQDDELALEFAEDGTMMFYTGGEGYGGTYTFNPVELTGTFTLTDFSGTTYYTFSMSADMLYVEDFPYARAGDPAIVTEPTDSLLGTWYDAAGEAGTLYFDKDGMVLMDTHGVMFSGTYMFDEDVGSGAMALQVDGETVEINLYLLYGTLYTDDTIYTRDVVEQAS